MHSASVRLASFHPCPAPYTTPVLNALSRRLELRVFYFAGESRESRFADTWGVEPDFDYTVLPARPLALPAINRDAYVSVGAARWLRRLRPDAVLVVSWQATGIEPLLWSRWSGRAAVMWSESTSFSGRFRGPVSSGLRRVLVHACDAYVTSGSQATRYLEALGAPSDRIVTSMLPAGMAPATAARSTRMSEEEAIRFLFVGRLIPRKRPLETIQAFAAARQALPDATLTIVGDGELEAEVRASAARVPGVEYIGRREGAELAAVYAESDVLVLPARREVWGVVVNEALSHGLFVITTDEVGSAHDLLDSERGVMLPARDLRRLSTTLIEAALGLDFGDEARRRRASVMEPCTPDRFARDIARAAELAVRVRASRWRRP